MLQDTLSACKSLMDFTVRKCSWYSLLSGGIMNEVRFGSDPVHCFSCYVLNLYYLLFFNCFWFGSHIFSCSAISLHSTSKFFLQSAFQFFVGCRPAFGNSFYSGFLGVEIKICAANRAHFLQSGFMDFHCETKGHCRLQGWVTEVASI